MLNIYQREIKNILIFTSSPSYHLNAFIKFNNFGTWHLNKLWDLVYSFCCTASCILCPCVYMSSALIRINIVLVNLLRIYYADCFNRIFDLFILNTLYSNPFNFSGRAQESLHGDNVLKTAGRMLKQIRLGCVLLVLTLAMPNTCRKD